ncbi:MAG: PDZ domain-containing protein [Planctomycetes bacterium]|nr:PDZ domain-containing protein [Planctomycetota bacterium]MCP4859743.1 PDZ domain-containing protein [Planctomycetota bacterium]
MVHIVPRNFLAVLLISILWAVAVAPLAAQVHYQPGGSPWNQRAHDGPDSEVPGWYYNLGITGIRVELTEDAPEWLLVKYVFEDSPAHKKVKVGDLIAGAGGKFFSTPHQNGYGMDKFGPDGPIADFAEALEACQRKKANGKLDLNIVRDGKQKKVPLSIGKKYGAFAKTFPFECAKTDAIQEDLYKYLLEHQRKDGSWGSPPHDTFAPLALMASGTKKHMAAAKKSVQFHAKNTSREDDSWLVNWKYMAAAIVMSEYYLITEEKWVLKELEEVYDFLYSSQYTDTAQINPKAKETHPHSFPKEPGDAEGGWGHNPGFEGYGPIAMLTAQGALAFALMQECGIEVDPKRHKAAYDFLRRGSGRNLYVWYADEAAGQDDWADMGRTGASAVAFRLSPFGKKSVKRGLEHGALIGEHPESFPDTHASPIMGMGYGAAGAAGDPKVLKKLMDANRWWFTLAQCTDGSFYYQPNRDNTGYGADSRIGASAVTAFILSTPKKNLRVTGRSE